MKFTSLVSGADRAPGFSPPSSSRGPRPLTGCSSASSTGTAAASTPPAASGAAGSGSQPTGSSLTVADVAPFSGPTPRSPHLPGLLLRRDLGHQRRGA